MAASGEHTMDSEASAGPQPASAAVPASGRARAPARRRQRATDGPSENKGKKKKKKLSRKARAALAKQEAEARRLAMIEDNDRLQRERADEELQQMRERSNLQKKLLQEQETRIEENAQVVVWLVERQVALEAHDAAKRRAEEWDRHVRCEQRPDPRVEKDMNTYICLWADRRETDVTEGFGHVQEAEAVVADAERVMAHALEREHNDLAARIAQDIQRLRDLADVKLDELTSLVMRQAVEHAADAGDGADDGHIEIALPDIRFGLWVNVQKNVRMKAREFPQIGMSTTLSRGLLFNRLAIRMVHLSWDNLSHTAASDEYVAVGGVLHFDVLEQPPQAKKVKGWTMQSETEMSTQLRRLGYPVVLPGTDPLNMPQIGQPNWSKLRVCYTMPEAAYVRLRSFTVGWWDAASRLWRTDGIEGASFDVKTRTVSFETIHCAPTAVLQSRYADLPFEHWSLAPTEPNKCMFAITGRELQIVVEIGEGFCRLTKPLDDCFKELRSNRFSPYLFMLRLARIGVNLIPTNASVPRLSGVRLKDPQLEAELHAEIALLSPAFCVSYSKWNAGRSAKKAVLKVCEALDRTFAGSAVAPKELTILYDRKHLNAVVLKADDSAEHFTEEKADRRELHRSVYMAATCVAEGCAEEAVMICRVASDTYTEAVRHFLNIIRPLSFVTE